MLLLSISMGTENIFQNSTVAKGRDGDWVAAETLKMKKGKGGAYEVWGSDQSNSIRTLAGE